MTDDGGYLTAADVVGRDPVPADRRISYGGGRVPYGELRLPEGRGPHPVLVLLHGGCWQARATPDYLSRLARKAGEWGWASWSLEFRTVDRPGGSWPGIFTDVAAGVDHLRSVAGDHPLDLSTVVASGHSSGGHLALWTASRSRLPLEVGIRGGRDPLPVVGVVSFAGICGVAAYHRMGEDARGCGDAVVRLLEGTPGERPRRLWAADPEARLPLGVPQLLLSGEGDGTVPPAHVEAWAARARKAGDEVVHRVVPGSGHFELVSPGTGPFAEVERILPAWLEERQRAASG